MRSQNAEQTSTSADDVHSNPCSPDITPEIHNDLVQQLKHNYKHIRFQYASYIRCIRISLGEKGVTVKELSSYLLSLPAFDYDVHNEVMSQKRNELEGASDIIDIFNIIARDHASFLEYDIFQGIVGEYKLDRSQEPLQYPDHLKAYIQKHTISEFMKLNPTLKNFQELSVIWLKRAGCEFTFEDTGTQG